MPASDASSTRAFPVVRLAGISKRYQMGDAVVTALDELSLEMARGSCWAILGPSGSGKSTLMNIIGCLDRPDTGQYVLEGVDVATMSDDALSDMRLRHLGFVFQSFHLLPRLTVEENIELPMHYLGLDERETKARAQELAERVGLADRLRHRPVELSGGQRQRVAIARSLANDPALILADEPTGNLDTKTSIQILDLLLRLNAEGRTVILVTHEADIAACARQRLHLRDGRVERVEGAP
ncbi:MAG TPA: ABC transporter ATP-binding protein [Kiritimatiellia bacterium]|nr:ABC transporter ATP-binding protein [Kiritimatiellia bacterium]